jgi:predicted permease
VIFAFTPALPLSFLELRNGLAEGSRGSAGHTWRRMGSRLVIVELATAMVLLAGAGLLGQSLYRLLHVYVGFDPDRLATLEVDAPSTGYTDAKAVALGREIVRRVSLLPGVQSAAIITMLPVSCNCNTDWIRFVGRPYDGHHIEVPERDVSAAYFTTVRARLRRGRYFTEGDDLSKPRVAIVNQTLAAKYFPGEDPIGKQFGDTGLTPKSIRTIVGVVDDMRDGSLDSDIWPTEYLPFNQSPDYGFNLVVRTAQAPEGILPTMSAAIRQFDPGIGTCNARSMTSRIADSPSAYIRRSSAWLVGGFAAVALLLSVVGLYGVIAYSVGQRTREIGVRIALGAERRSVYSLILKEAGSLAGIGILAGLFASLLGAKLLRKLLFGVESWDIPTLLTVAAVLAVAALLASYIPARRAASVDPVEALRAE